MANTKAKLRVASKSDVDQLSQQTLLATNSEAALPLLSMIGQAQLSIEDLLGHLSRQFVEQLLVLSAQSVAGAQHKGRRTGDVRWHGSQSGVVNLGKTKLRVQRPRLRGARGEVKLPAYDALSTDTDLSRRIADILVCNVSTPVVVKQVVAFLLANQAALRSGFESLFLGVLGLRCTSVMGLQSRVGPLHRRGCFSRAAA